MPTPRPTRDLKLTYSLAQVYFEIARSAIGTIKPGRIRRLRRSRGLAVPSSMLFAAGSLTVVYSFLAVEAMVNYHLYQLWVHKSGVAKGTLQQKFPTANEFGDLRKTKLRELRQRIKVLCTLLGIDPPHKVMPEVWASFTELCEAARHFLTHPIPEPAEFQQRASLILHRTPAGRFVETAGRLIAHFYIQRGGTPPSWLTFNERVSVTIGPPPRRRRSKAEDPSNLRLQRPAAAD